MKDKKNDKNDKSNKKDDQSNDKKNDDHQSDDLDVFITRVIHTDMNVDVISEKLHTRMKDDDLRIIFSISISSIRRS